MRGALLLALSALLLVRPAAVAAQAPFSPAPAGAGPTLAERLEQIKRESPPGAGQPPPAWAVTAYQAMPVAGATPVPPVADRLRQLEQTNAELQRQVEELSKKYDTLVGRRQGQSAQSGGQGAGNARQEGALRTAGERRSGEAEDETVEEERGPYEPNMEPLRRIIVSSFQEGLRFRTADDFFALEFHNLTQVDYRAPVPTGDPLHDSFVIPRQRWYFIGHVSEYVDYYTVINRGYGTIDLLDAWADIALGEELRPYFQLRVGRMKTPYTYEYTKMAESDLVAAERSLFVGNFAPNRMIGAMAHGRVLNQQVEYYVGVFNGGRRSFQDTNDEKDVFFYANTKPFLYSDWEFLRELNLGGSFNFGQERNPATPAALTTANDDTNSAGVYNVSPTFLALNSNVFENGPRAQWSGDVAYYFRSFNLLAGIQGGFQDYSVQNGTPAAAAIPTASGDLVGYSSSRVTHVQLFGWNVTASYFLTGEQVTRRAYLLEPIRPLNFRHGDYGFGAVEAYARFSNLHVGDNILGLTTPFPWSDTANAIDAGFNWYLNNYVKITLDWQHSYFPTPVYVGPNRTTRQFDLAWFRTQIFF
jgi:phosphate-selective porin OprO/OprP